MTITETPKMNSSVKLIYEELIHRGIDVTPVGLVKGGTLLLFMHNGVRRAITGTTPDLTSATGVKIADNKYAASIAAQQAGIAVPETLLYDDEGEARAFLKRHKRIVVKPLDSSHGNGITTNVVDELSLTAAVEKARQESDVVLLQQYVTGSDLRVVVIDGKVVAVAERVPAAVIGDGVHTIQDLIIHENATNPLRGEYYEKPLNVISLEAAIAYLSQDGLTRIPDSNERVQVVGTANIGTGGHAEDKTHSTPKAILDDAIAYAEATGTFVCGVDFLVDEATGQWFFIEANTSPSFGLHVWPTKGEPVDMANIFLDAVLATSPKP